MQSNRYFNHIESIRAVAAVAVAVFHFTNYHNGKAFLVSNSTVREAFTFGAQGVEMFYIISGFVITFSLYKAKYKLTSYFKYISKRLIRIFPPYLITILLINLVGYYLTTFLWGGDFQLKVDQLFTNIFFIVDLVQQSEFLSEIFPNNRWINPIFPTLKVELQFYIIIGLLFPFINKSVFRLIGTSILLLAIGVVTKNHYTTLVNMPFFILGIASFYIFEKGWKTEFIALIVLSFLSLILFYAYKDSYISVITLLLILMLPQKFNVFGYTGKISYSYYLTHGLTGGWFLYFSSKYNFVQEHSYLFIIFALLISWLGAFIIYHLIERPSMKFSKQIKY